MGNHQPLIKRRKLVLIVAVLTACLVLGGDGQAFAKALLERSTAPATAGHPLTIRDLIIPRLPYQITAAQALLVRPMLDCGQQACIALTFDDGPDPAVTSRILAILQQHDVVATFFVVGSRLHGNEHIVRQIYAAGSEIGNHGWSHHDLTKLTPEQVQYEYIQTQQAIVASGVPEPIIFRPPYGAINDVVRTHIPHSLALWNVDPVDWALASPTEVVAHITQHARPGRVILLHDIRPITAEALPAIIQTLQAQGYRLVTFSQLFNLTPASRGTFYGR
jgi:peptidoglycan/xylan/chitin deacetylase (PgdA/CDA1 family)